MTLAPSAPDARRDAAIYDSGGSGGSGGGSPPRTNANPIVRLSGGGSAGAQGAGSISIAMPVSVGLSLDVRVEPADDEFSPLKTITISGMSDISSYFSTAPNENAPSSVTVGHDVLTDPPPIYEHNKTVAYTHFVVDADPRTYNVTVKVEYQNGDKGTTTVSFTSKRPQGTLSVVDHGQTEVSIPGYNGRLAYFNNDPNADSTSGILVQAQTTPISHVENGVTKYIAGTFMIMQTSDAWNWSYTTTDGKTYSMKNSGIGSVLDNGLSSSDLPKVGSKIYDPVTFTPVTSYDGRGWDLPYQTDNVQVTTATYVYGDTPNAGPDPMIDNLSSVTVGRSGGAPEEPGAIPDEFTTYLMYRATDGGVWVALAKVHWSWGGHATSILDPLGGRVLDPTSLTRSGSVDPAVQSLGGSKETQAEAFPTWTGTTYAIGGAGWQLDN